MRRSVLRERSESASIGILIRQDSGQASRNDALHIHESCRESSGEDQLAVHSRSVAAIDFKEKTEVFSLKTPTINPHIRVPRDTTASWRVRTNRAGAGMVVSRRRAQFSSESGPRQFCTPTMASAGRVRRHSVHFDRALVLLGRHLWRLSTGYRVWWWS